MTPAYKAAYKALYERLRSGILSGQLAVGARLPPSRTLAAETGLSRNTVLAAFQQLEAEGYIVGRRGSGTYVAEILPEQLLSATVSSAPAPTSTTGGVAALSARGQRLAQTRRVALPAVLGQVPRGTAFLIGLPALDHFPFATWAKLYADRLRTSATQLMRYDDPAGYRPLREAIAAYVGTTRGIHCSAEQVIVTSGSQQALELSARILLDPGDPAWLEDPGYLGARAALVSAGARLVPVPVDADGLDVTAGVAREPRARLAVRDAVVPVPAGPHDVPAAQARAHRVGAARTTRGSSRTTTTASSATPGGRSPRCRGLDTRERVVTSARSARSSSPGCGWGT